MCHTEYEYVQVSRLPVISDVCAGLYQSCKFRIAILVVITILCNEPHVHCNFSVAVITSTVTSVLLF
jgi:hypothetical protein